MTSPAWCAPACPAYSDTKSGTLGALHAGASAVARVCAAPRAACTARTHAATTRLCRVVCSHPLSSSSPSVSAAATLAADAMWIGSPSHRCSAITYSDERSLNWLGPGMACSHALASGCATPMSREHSRSATFTPHRSPSSPAAPVISSSHEPS